MCTSVNPNTNQPGLMNTASYRANWYSLTFDTDPSYCFISQANIRVRSVRTFTKVRLSARHCKRRYKSHAQISTTTYRDQELVQWDVRLHLIKHYAANLGWYGL